MRIADDPIICARYNRYGWCIKNNTEKQASVRVTLKVPNQMEPEY